MDYGISKMDICTSEKLYKKPILLERGNATFKGSLCFCNLCFSYLNTNVSTFLHPQELTTFMNFKHEKRQQSFLLGRFTAKHAITTLEIKSDLNDILIENGVFQQPIVKCHACNNLHVSISHTSALGAAIAFEEAHPMAIDVETISADRDDVILSQLTAKEQQFLLGSTITEIFSFWTAKEALSKVLKCGFMISFDLLEIASCRREHHSSIYYFKNFPQYQALTFQPELTSMCSIVYPRSTTLNLDIYAIKQALYSHS